MKKIVTRLASLAMAFVIVASLAACSESGSGNAGSADKVVAEATGHTSHGYEVEVLYQEYGDGSAKVHLAFHSDDLGAMGVTYNGTVTKGKDADGDPLVTLTVGDYTLYASPEKVDTSNGAVDIGMDYNFGDQTTNTYDASAGTYSLPFSLSIFGYAEKSVTLEVAPTSSPTDAAEWYSGYGIPMA